MERPIDHWPGRLIGPVHVRSTPGNAAEQAVFVHGLAGSATNWTDLMGLLQDEVTGHALDLPGAGYSPAPDDGDYSIDGHVRAVVGLIERIGAPVHLFGNSLGGAVSVRLAATRPELVRTLTLVSPALPDLLPRYGPARVAVSATPGLGDWAVKRFGAVSPERRLRATMSVCYADADRVHPDRLRDAIEELRRRDALPYAGMALLKSARGIVREYFTGRLWRDVDAVTAPTLVIHGRRDKIVHRRMAIPAGRRFRDVRLVTLADAGHVAQMEVPEAVAREARRLILDARLSEPRVSSAGLGNAGTPRLG
ncbi:alpha/beta fold hydrolase [Streptosporangiaceae bacterium NEAU-GS5]|nr:alpha/beta fold hydrolase [Streptosporangiaceae bacterium NEAU-GS5]